ncbi:hypothetical protein BKA69DRAFT_1122543 [Paraphysoderma sedebokerense]|nr:hypothetical protein BKA69DRAFT_1122543 [Paraphysoderma sedebokerense]
MQPQIPSPPLSPLDESQLLLSSQKPTTGKDGAFNIYAGVKDDNPNLVTADVGGPKYLQPPRRMPPSPNPFHPSLSDLIVPMSCVISVTSIYFGPIYFPNVYVNFLVAFFTYYATITGLQMYRFYQTAGKLELCVSKHLEIGMRDNQEFFQNLHIFVIPNYNEPLSLLKSTITRLASHKAARTNYVVVLAMEMNEKDHHSKAAILTTLFEDSFFGFVTTVHELLPHETKGKGSNVSHAVKCVYRWIQDQGINEEWCVLTISDADSGIGEGYVRELNESVDNMRRESVEEHNKKNPSKKMQYRQMKKPHGFTSTPVQPHTILRIFSPPIFFARNTCSVPAMVRVTDAMWSVAMMQNLCTGRGLAFPCSTYSLTLPLAHLVSYWDTTPQSIGEDLHMALKCFFLTRALAKFTPIFYPINLSNVECSLPIPSLPDGYEELSLKQKLDAQSKYWYKQLERFLTGMRERFIQGKRHLWGTADSGFVFGFLLAALGLNEKVEDARVVDKKGNYKVSSLISHYPPSYQMKPKPRLPLPPLPTPLYTLFDHFLAAVHVLEAHFLPAVSWLTLLAVPFGRALNAEYSDPSAGWIHLKFTYVSYMSTAFLVFVAFSAIRYEFLHRFMDNSGVFSDIRTTKSPTLSSSKKHSRKISSLDFSGSRLSPQPTKTRYLHHLLDYIVLPLAGMLFVAIPSTTYCFDYFKGLWKGEWKFEYVVAGKGQESLDEEEVDLPTEANDRSVLIEKDISISLSSPASITCKITSEPSVSIKSQRFQRLSAPVSPKDLLSLPKNDIRSTISASEIVTPAESDSEESMCAHKVGKPFKLSKQDHDSNSETDSGIGDDESSSNMSNTRDNSPSLNPYVMPATSFSVLPPNSVSEDSSVNSALPAYSSDNFDSSAVLISTAPNTTINLNVKVNVNLSLKSQGSPTGASSSFEVNGVTVSPTSNSSRIPSISGLSMSSPSGMKKQGRQFGRSTAVSMKHSRAESWSYPRRKKVVTEDDDDQE